MSLVDEARHTGRRVFTNADSKLRNIPVKFVSAGQIIFDEETPDEQEHKGVKSSKSKPECEQDSASPSKSSHMQQNCPGTRAPILPPSEAQGGASLDFALDSKGRADLKPTDCPNPQIPPSRPRTPSDSEEDVVLFKGRKNGAQIVEGSIIVPKVVELDEIPVEHQSHELTTKTSSKRDRRDPGKKHARKAEQDKQRVEAEIFADYIAHVQDDEGDTDGLLLQQTSLAFRTRDLDPLLQDISSRERSGNVEKLRTQGSATPDRDTVDLQDFQVLSTSSKASRRVGNSSDSDERFEDQVLAQESRSMAREEKALQKLRDSMTDEGIAARLSKQEELGLGTDELILFGADEAEILQATEMDSDSSLQINVKGSDQRSQRHGRPPRSHQIDGLHSREHEEFDVMDRDRPSLRQAHNGRRRTLPFEPSDSDLAETMRLAWEKDREVKKLRKQEREKLRVQGLLDHNGTIDIRHKYKHGMSLLQIRQEMEMFIASRFASYEC